MQFAKMDKKKILNYVIIFLIAYLAIGVFFRPNAEDSNISGNDIVLSPLKKEFSLNEQVSVELSNTTSETVTIKSDCPNEPLDVFTYKKGEWVQKTHTAEIDCSNISDIVVEPGSKAVIPYTSWSNALFNETGRYKISTKIGGKTIESGEFEIKAKGVFGTIWTDVFYRPIYNILIFLASSIPFKDLGLAIILLTIIIRAILLVPSHKALKSQRKLQEVQPKLAKIREKYKDNQEMIAKETMALWKEHKVNPLGSCLPLLVQFPFLIAIFYVIQSGLNPDDAYLLYEPFKDFSLTAINVNFLNILDLTKVNAFVLPLIVGGLQFSQMKLTMAKKGPKKEGVKNEMESANQIMVYVMPVMIAVFTATLPAGVGLYWGTSTIFGVAQQLIVNRQVDSEKSQVRVIKK